MFEGADQAPVREGEIIAGKYKVERILGIGGMGVVVAAMHLELEQRVALKFLLPQGASNPEVAARFAREARAAAKIKCEHVARVIDVGTLPTGAPYMVMEFMDGDDLDRLLETFGPMPFHVVANYVLQALEAIAEAHALGIVHRDLKPANLFLAKQPSADPIVKVLDFGISKSQQSAQEANLTKTAAVMGSPLYMSPEQMASARKVDPRSDIWSLGVVLYQLLTNAPPFMADTMTELIVAILQAPAPSVRVTRPEVPPELAAIIDRCLQKDPAARYQNVAELAAALGPFGGPEAAMSVQRVTRALGLSPVQVGAAGGMQPAGPGMMTTQGVHGALPPGAVATNAQWSQSVAGAGPRKSSAGLLVGLGVVVAAAVIGAFVVIKMQRPASTAAALPAASAEAIAVPSVSTSVPAPSVAALLPPAESALPEVADPAIPGKSAAKVTPVAVTAGHAPPTTKPASAKPASSGPTCTVSTYIDVDGNKRFARECK